MRRALRLSWLGIGIVLASVGVRDATADVSVPRSHHAVDGCAGPHGAQRPGCAGAAIVGAARPSAGPICGNEFGPGRVVSGVSESGVQEALLGASASGATLLFLRGPSHACVGRPGGTSLLIADRADASASAYAIADVTTLAAFSRFARLEATMTVSPDGNGVIGSAANNDGFLVSIRSRIGATDFATPVPGPFATITLRCPSRPGSAGRCSPPTAWPSTTRSSRAVTLPATASTNRCAPAPAPPFPRVRACRSWCKRGAASPASGPIT